MGIISVKTFDIPTPLIKEDSSTQSLYEPLFPVSPLHKDMCAQGQGYLGGSELNLGNSCILTCRHSHPLSLRRKGRHSQRQMDNARRGLRQKKIMNAFTTSIWVTCYLFLSQQPIFLIEEWMLKLTLKTKPCLIKCQLIWGWLRHTLNKRSTPYLNAKYSSPSAYIQTWDLVCWNSI